MNAIHLKYIINLWRFSRPHTIIGTAISICVLYLLAGGFIYAPDTNFWLTLTAALLCNIFITGYNQVVDVALDKINKPNLPIASGALTLYHGKLISWVSLTISLGLAMYLSIFLASLIFIIAVLGFVYSWRGVYLKKHHTSAAAAITVVRGVLINIGFYLHFAKAELSFDAIPAEIWLLVVFVSLFSIGISWFKDIPDTRGDALAGIDSLAIKAGIEKTYRAGVYAVATGYVLGSFAPLFFTFTLVNGPVLCVGHTMIGLAFISVSGRVELDNLDSIRKFYMAFWIFFFLEYLLFGATLFV
jgi:homogentisate phytyltransferase/homogentisate geranylgeranyltransferase